jgi:hypothetical protein
MHHVVAKTYVGAAPRSFSFAGAAQATSWIVTTFIALALILQGKVGASPPLEDSQFCGGSCLSRGARDSGRDPLGKSKGQCRRNGGVGLQRVRLRGNRHRGAVRGNSCVRARPDLRRI